MMPVVCVVGRSESGKTTLIEGLIPELKRRGYRVATIKHNPHGFELDKPGKDSWRHAQAGSDTVIISSPQKLALIRSVDHDATIRELVHLLGVDYDIVLIEGFSKGAAPKIGVHRKELGEDLLLPPKELIAIVSDEPLEADIPQFTWEEIEAVASFIEERIIARWPAENTTLFINGSPISLNRFAKRFISNVVIGMASALRGVEKIRSLGITVKKG
jgi:molybdopterin-guanine dinucleotide biosynthesis protein B